jgi:hypothetical protein
LQIAKIRASAKCGRSSGYNNRSNIAVILNAIHCRNDFGNKRSGQCVAFTRIIQGNGCYTVGNIKEDERI